MRIISSRATLKARQLKTTDIILFLSLPPKIIIQSLDATSEG